MRLYVTVLIVICIIVLSLSACTVEIKTPGIESALASPATASAAEASIEPTISPTPEPTSEPTPSPTPGPSINMYTSYADLVSFDPSSGEAEFDYWEMLQGDRAVEWLVEHEGYSLADAQEEVDNYADSEFIKKNTNPQLRMVDLSSVPLRMMYHPDGTMLTGAGPIATSYTDFCGLYAAHPNKVLHSFFYRVIVSDDASIRVDQVFWP